MLLSYILDGFLFEADKLEADAFSYRRSIKYDVSLHLVAP